MIEVKYKGCYNCVNAHCDEFEEPCINCRNSFVIGSKEYNEHPLLWKSKDDPVTHPSHYTQGGIECIDAMVSAFGEAAVATWCKCNAFKYIWREAHKNGMEDIDKAIWYLNKFKELSASG